VRRRQFGAGPSDDLQSFAPVGFQIGQEADLFEEFTGEVLRSSIIRTVSMPASTC